MNDTIAYKKLVVKSLLIVASDIRSCHGKLVVEYFKIASACCRDV